MKQIIAMGGGGFLAETTLVLDRYVLAQTGKPRPKICFLPHATDNAPSQAERFWWAHSQLDCEPSVYSLFTIPPAADLVDLMLSQDVITVGGGNTKSMLALWRAWGLEQILRQAYEQGIVLAGMSAGANCWFEDCVTDSATPQLSALPCLGVLEGSFCPHYDGEIERRPAYHRLLESGLIRPGIACDDGAAAHFIDGSLDKVVASRPGAKGYSVRSEGGRAIEEPLATQLL